MTRIVVAEGNEIVQHGLVTILQQEASFTVVAVAQQGAEALAACRSLRPDLLLLNLRLPDGDGLGVARQVSLLQRGPRILLLSAVSDALVVQAAREAAGPGLPAADRLRRDRARRHPSHHARRTGVCRRGAA